jgi:hypothetical protein
MKKRVSVFCAALALALASTGAAAETAFGEETFVARLGGYFSEFDTNVKLSGPNGGDSINLEDALGLDSGQTVFRGSLAWRFAPRHRIELEYVDFRRDATGTSTRSFTVDTENGTYLFDVGATLETSGP